MKLGVQLYGVLAEEKGDVLDALQRLAKLGYGAVEPCVALEPVPLSERVAWPAPWLLAHFDEIEALGLEIRSCHVFAADPAAHVGVLKQLAARGVRHFVGKLPQKKDAVSLQEAAFRMMRLADALEDTGAKVLIHNEAADIETKIGGKTAYEAFLDLCMGKVFAQVDTGWVWAAGEDPEALLWRNRDRVRSVHYKDFLETASGEREQTFPGGGAAGCAACVQFARFLGVPQIVDQDRFPKGDREADLAEALRRINGLNSQRARTVSFLNVLDVETGEVRVLRRYEGLIEAPNWLKKSDAILYNADGRIFRHDLRTGEDTVIDTGICTNCNNDHVVSADEVFLAVSHSEGGFSSRVYTVPIGGGAAKLVTPGSPSYLHGWSPDGAEMAYCAFRTVEGKLEVDVYAIPAEGGEEKRLTQGGFNDGPEYSPDGEYIWFNSTRSGLMQIWRMRRDGSEPTQMTKNERNNWFAHISPDGKRVAYISYRKGDLEPREHLPNMQVELWLMNADGTDQHRVLSLFGGQGTVNVNSWAGDSRRLAFVSYALQHN